MKLYPLGYVFSEEKLNDIPEHFNNEIIQDKYFYYYDEDVKPYIKEKNDAFLIVHGEFLYAGKDTNYSKNELVNLLFNQYIADYNKFLDTLDFIAGRYVIIVGLGAKVEFYPDAANTRSTYFSSHKNIFSSHVSLINDQYKHSMHKYSKVLSTLNNALYYTAYEGIKSSLPNFKIDFHKKTYERFFPRRDNEYTRKSEINRFELFEQIWYQQLDYYFKNYSNFVFSITGGGDSRFSLAFLKDYLNKIQFFTYTTSKEDDNTSSSTKGLSLDRKIVEQIISDINLTHKFIYYRDNEKPLSDKEKHLLSKNTIAKHSSFLIPHIQEQYPQDNLKHIRGNLLEIGQTRNFRTRLKESNFEELKNTYDSRYKKGISLEYEKEYYELFDFFIEDLNYMDNTFDYHILDLFHWELRMGRWHSEILNTHDIIFDTINPFNHRAIIDISLSFPYEKRNSEYMFKELINRNFAVLNFYGDNKEENLYEQQRKKIYNI